MATLLLALAVVPSLQDAASAGSKVPPPAIGAYLGAFVDPDARWDGLLKQEAEVTHLERILGRKLAIDHHYYGWSGDSQMFPAAIDRWDVQHGRIPMISWEGTNLNRIVSGSQDSVIRSRARRVKQFGHPIFISWGYEMNGDWNEWSGIKANSPGTTNGPAKFVKAWRRIHRIFHDVGAHNVSWVWTPNDRDVPSSSWNHWTRYYPGDAYVDWVGVDGYNWGTAESWSRWTPFWQLFRGVYRDYSGRKPITVVETGSTEKGGDKAAWISGMWKALVYRYPRIKAVVWTDRGPDWKVETSSSAVGSFRRMADSPFMMQRRDPSAPALRDLAPSGGSVSSPVALEFWLSEPARVAITIRNGSGNVVRSLGGAAMAPGDNAITWNLRNGSGHHVSPGVYRWTVRAVDPTRNARSVTASVTVG